MPDNITDSVKEKWMYQPKEGEQFFFMHIPKTGGTTLRHILMSHFPEGSYYPTLEELKENNGSYLSQKELIHNDSGILSRSLIMGHYNLNLVKKLNPNVKVIAFFRNPIDRVYSHLKHISHTDPSFSGASMNTIAEDRLDRITNVQSSMLLFKNNNLAELKRNVSSLDFVGITEYFDESLDMLNAMFEWDLKPIEKRNKSINNLQQGLSGKAMSKLCKNILPEIVTYNNACQALDSRLRNKY